MELTKQQMFELNKKYLHEGGVRCPICEGIAIADDSMEGPETGQVWQKIRCDSCNETWSDIYKLVKIEDVKIGMVVP